MNLAGIRTLRTLCIAAAIVAGGRAFAGGCTQWLPGPLVPPINGANGPVYAALEWTPIGQSPLLIIAGAFTQVGGAEVNNIAAWDGQFWRALGTGLNGPVRSLTAYNNQLIAGGDFVTPGRRIATWNGSTWAAMGDFGQPEFDPQESVYALRVFNGELYAGGNFCCVNGTPVISHCRRYLGGTSWTEAAGMVGTVRALEVFDADGAGPLAPALYIGGAANPSFETPLRRSVDGFNAVDVPGPMGIVYCLAVMNELLNDEPYGLIVGGRFTNWMNNADAVPVNNIARYDGTFGFALAEGIGDRSSQINAVREFNGYLFAGGAFETNNFQGWGVWNVAQFLGQTHGWDTFGSPSVDGGGVVGNAVHALAARSVPFSGSLLVGGDYTGVFGVMDANNIATYSPFVWSRFNENLNVRATAVLGSRLIMGGQFSQSVPASGTVRNPWNIMTWDGVNKGSLGLGTNGAVRSLLAYTSGSGPLASNVVIAGGDFTTVYGDALNPAAPIAANRIAQWTESPFGQPTWSNMGLGFDGSVNAIERFMGSIVAGGSFGWTGLTQVNYLSRYVGNPPAWQQFMLPSPNLNGAVHALKAWPDDLGGNASYLVIAGAFTSAPGAGVAANRIVLRKESPVFGESEWQALGAGFNSTVYAVERHGTGLIPSLYAAGDFTASGATPVNRIARLSGANWVAVGNGIGFNDRVTALRSSGAFLYASGRFTSVDGIAANGIARWNGSAWSAVDVGIAGPADGFLSADALSIFRGEVVAGGTFAAVGAPQTASPALARFTPTNVPWIAQHPTSRSIACGAATTFNVTAATGYPGLTYMWRRNGAPIGNGGTPHGSIISGADTASLSITNARTGDAGSYDCVIASDCGNVASNAATLTVATCCVADIAPAIGDGAVNTDDLLQMLSSWGSCATPCPPMCKADIAPVAGDCAVNTDDLLAMLSAWGPCP